MRPLTEECKDKRKHPRQKSYLLLMRQERHQGQRPPRLHTLHHWRRHVDDVQCNIPANLEQNALAESHSSIQVFYNHQSFFIQISFNHCSFFVLCSLGQYATAGAIKALELEDAGVVQRQVLHGVPRRGAETFQASVALEPGHNTCEGVKWSLDIAADICLSHLLSIWTKSTARALFLRYIRQRLTWS